MKIILSLCAFVVYVSSGSIPQRNAFMSSISKIGYSRIPRFVDTRIVGGHPVSVVMHPHQISLRFKYSWATMDPYSHICGGSIQSERIIITAAHCVEDSEPSEFQVVGGTSNRNGNDGFISPVEKIIVHEDYDPSILDNDIAIIILGAPLPLNNFTLRAIELAETDSRNGVMSTVTGWGTTTEGGYLANYLQEVHVPIVSNEICNEDYEGEITDSMLCAGVRGVGGKDACQGDSGGPLVVNGKLAGIVSWGYGCARPEYPGVYSKVSYLHPWLMEQISKINRILSK